MTHYVCVREELNRGFEPIANHRSIIVGGIVMYHSEHSEDSEVIESESVTVESEQFSCERKNQGKEQWAIE